VTKLPPPPPPSWSLSPKNHIKMQAFCAAQSSGASDDIIVDDGLDLDQDLEVHQLPCLLFTY
jgi:hypothetical protein